MSDQPWKTDDWFSSAWNYNDQVTRDFNFPESIRIHDVSLRDGEQQTAIAYTYDDKIRIAEALAEAGIHRIEAGLPAVSKDDFRAIEAIVKRNLGPDIYSFCRCMKADIDASVDCGVKGPDHGGPGQPAPDRTWLQVAPAEGHRSVRRSHRLRP